MTLTPERLAELRAAAEKIVQKWEVNDEWNRRADARHEPGAAGLWLARIVEQRKGLPAPRPGAREG